MQIMTFLTIINVAIHLLSSWIYSLFFQLSLKNRVGEYIPTRTKNNGSFHPRNSQMIAVYFVKSSANVASLSRQIVGCIVKVMMIHFNLIKWIFDFEWSSFGISLLFSFFFLCAAWNNKIII